MAYSADNNINYLGTTITDGFTAVSGTPHTVDPISRIEGHLGVRVDVDASGVIQEADVHGNLWRGFENFLLGRDPNDAITFVQRICGVCPIPHGMTSTFAVESVLGLNDSFQTLEWDGTKGVPARAMWIRNIVLASEFIMSHITHFYHLAAPSYVQGPAVPPWTPYFHVNDYALELRSVGRALPQNGVGAGYDKYSKDLWSAVIKQYVKALRIRRLTFEAGALYAGRMPMTSCYVAGGVTNDKNEDIPTFRAKIQTFYTLMQEVGAFIVTEYVPLALALGALYKDFDNVNNGGKGWGGGVGNFLSWGAFPQSTAVSGLLYARKWVTGASGTPDSGTITKADVEAELTESVFRSHYDAQPGTATAPEYDEAMVAYPGVVTKTIPNRSRGYSWLKAPRWNDLPMEVGPFARMVVNGKYKVGSAEDKVLIKETFGLSTDYTAPASYAKTLDGGASGMVAGPDPKLVAVDLAVGCLRSGLADVILRADLAGHTGIAGVQNYVVGNVTSNLSSTATYTSPILSQTMADCYFIRYDHIALTDHVIGDAYLDPTAVITGTVGDWIAGLQGGLSTMDRLRARALEAALLIQILIGGFDKDAGWAGGAYDTGTGKFANDPGDGTTKAGWLGKLSFLQGASNATWTQPVDPATYTMPQQGFGATEAPRGALMHQITIANSKIAAYQCIVPTTWNASPKSAAAATTRGPMEAAMVGAGWGGGTSSFGSANGTTTVSGKGGVEALRIAQSFDPCIACAVH